MTAGACIGEQYRHFAENSGQSHIGLTCLGQLTRVAENKCHHSGQSSLSLPISSARNIFVGACDRPTGGGAPSEELPLEFLSS